MSLTADTVENVLQIISDLRGESATNTDSSRVRAVSRAEIDIANRTFFRVHLIRNQSIGTGDDSTTDFTIGTATYPMRPKGFAELFVGGTTEAHRYTIVDFMVYQNLVNANSAERVAYEWYDAANDLWKVHINPAPADGDSVTASWFYLPPKRDDTADTVVAPNIKALARLAMADIYEAEDEIQKAILAKQEAEQMIAELIGLENTPSHNQLYAMNPIESQIRTKSIGNY